MSHDMTVNAFVVWAACLFTLGPIAAVVSSNAASRRRRRRWEYVLWALFLAPLVIFSASGAFPHVLKLFGIPILIAVAIYYGITKPAREKKWQKVQDLYMQTKSDHSDPRYSFDPAEATIILTDKDVHYVSDVMPIVSFRRLCKNSHGEYFLVEAGESEISIRHLTLEKAKNSIRHNGIAFKREFGAKIA